MHLATAIEIECDRHRYFTYFVFLENIMKQLKRALLENLLESRVKLVNDMIKIINKIVL